MLTLIVVAFLFSTLKYTLRVLYFLSFMVGYLSLYNEPIGRLTLPFASFNNFVVYKTIVFVSKMPFMVGSEVQIDGGYTAG